MSEGVMRRQGRGGNRGMALLLVVAVISLLTVVIIQFNRSMGFTLVETTRHQDREVLQAIAESGIDIGCAALVTDRRLSEFDTLLDGWAKLADEPLVTPFSQGEVRVTIIDLAGRFPVNSLVAVIREGENHEGNGPPGPTPDQARETFLRLLVDGPFAIEDETEAREIVDSLVDWLDSDDEEMPYGAESSYYEAREKSYTARNGLVEFMDELLLVKGITADLLYGNDENVGLAEYITVYGVDGRVNINTAEPEIIQALDDRIRVEDTELIDEFRRDEGSLEALQESSWYRGVAGWPGDITIDESLITTESSYFLIRADAGYRDSRMRLSAVVRRPDEQQLEFLYFRKD